MVSSSIVNVKESAGFSVKEKECAVGVCGCGCVCVCVSVGVGVGVCGCVCRYVLSARCLNMHLISVHDSPNLGTASSADGDLEVEPGMACESVERCARP